MPTWSEVGPELLKAAKDFYEAVAHEGNPLLTAAAFGPDYNAPAVTDATAVTLRAAIALAEEISD